MILEISIEDRVKNGSSIKGTNTGPIESGVHATIEIILRYVIIKQSVQ